MHLWRTVSPRGLNARMARHLCPFANAVTEVELIEDGVALYLPPKVQTDAVLAHMRCHHAFGRYHGFEGMSQCPLYLPGIDISPDESRNAIRVTSTDREVVRLVQARAIRATHAPHSDTTPAKGTTP